MFRFWDIRFAIMGKKEAGMTDTKGCLCPVYGWENDGGEFDPTRAGGANGSSFYEYRISRYMIDVRRYIKDFCGLKK